MQQPASNAATAKFQLALPALLTPISPHLAALHATRARLLHPADTSLATTHCARCGSPFLANGGHTRSIRKKRKSSAGAPFVIRILRRSCRVCGHDDDIPLDTSNAPAFPKPRDRARRKSSTTPHVSSAAPVTAAKPAAPASMQQHAPVSQPHASRSLQSPATPGSSRSSSLTPAPSRSASLVPSGSRSTPTPAGSAAPAKPGQMSVNKQEAPQSKARPKKKAGLQSLLARNREKQEQEKKREGQGLSAFLQGL
ncbi:hypothetical protein OH77DRAFT_1231972 [Trametes cingulata]|nr:hypothetical protein OH77DRAFT_1231972 [Trametes cingulata]